MGNVHSPDKSDGATLNAPGHDRVQAGGPGIARGEKINVPMSGHRFAPGQAPARAMVLAAGLGLRMRPLTLSCPKPLLRVGGRTLLDHALDRLSLSGVEQAVVNTHYLGHMITKHLSLRRRPEIVLSPEDTLLETGGGIRNALPLLGEGCFAVANADILWCDGEEPAILRLAAAWNPEQMDALLLLVPRAKATGYDGPGDFSFTAAPGEAQTVAPLHRRPADGEAEYVFAGVHLTHGGLYHDTPEGPFSCNLVWDRALSAGRLWGLVHDGAWFHVGTPDALEGTDMHLRALARKGML